MDALDVDAGYRDRSEDTFCLTHHSRSISHSFSGGGTNSIDPKTDRAISSELSRVYLDSAVKARIRAVIYRELKRNAQLNPISQDRQRHYNKVTSIETSKCHSFHS